MRSNAPSTGIDIGFDIVGAPSLDASGLKAQYSGSLNLIGKGSCIIIGRIWKYGILWNPTGDLRCRLGFRMDLNWLAAYRSKTKVKAVRSIRFSISCYFRVMNLWM